MQLSERRRRPRSALKICGCVLPVRVCFQWTAEGEAGVNWMASCDLELVQVEA